MTRNARPCPGCGLVMPADETAAYEGYYYASPECWSVYTEVLAAEYSHAVLYGQVHQLTVDAYAVQHAGGPHPDKSVGIHLAGLHLMLERAAAPPDVPRLRQRLARAVPRWPRFDPPATPEEAPPTVLHVALADSAEAHAAQVRTWARHVWGRWQSYRDRIAALVASHLDDG